MHTPTTPRPLFRFTDAQWRYVGYLASHNRAQGRPLSDERGRMEAIFHVALSRRPWREMPEAFGKPDTVHRHFRRLAQEGVWERLLIALNRLPNTPLSELRAALCLVARRSWRLRERVLWPLARKLRLPLALPKPPDFLPRPEVDAFLKRMPAFAFLGNRPLSDALRDPALSAAVGSEIRLRRELHTIAGGLRRLPAWLRALW